ncbi:calcium-binding protein [Acinetobacter oleivorans]|uniref:calcium-binding protein n=1 Tax=Acinetobacter oleivorans TaxID=1148157 RepID=UPI003A84E683
MDYIDNILISLKLPITNLSLDQGLQALNSLTNNGIDVVDKNILRDLVNRVSADAPGSVTVLYSGEVNSEVGLKPLSIINAMRNNGDDIRVIMESPAAKLLGDIGFRSALADSFNVDIDNLDIKDTDANKFLESPDGLWGDVSANFIDATEGKVLTITGGAEDSRIFSQRELEKIQANEKIISVDGLDRTYLSNMSQEQAYKVIKVASDTSLANLHIVVDGNGNPALYGRQIMIDSRDFLASVNVDGHVSSNTAKYFASNTDAAMARVIEFVPAERWVEHTEGLNTLSSLELFGRFVGKLSVGISVLGLLVVSSQAQAAETPEQKQQIIDDWVTHTTAEWIAGSIGSALLVGGVAAFTAVSAPVTLGLAIVGGIVGSVVGGDTVYELIKEGVNKVLSDIKSSLHSIVGEFLDQFDLNDVMGLYEQAEHVTSPLILDLNKDGVVGTRALSENIYFDHDGSGFKEKTGWVSSQDGLLVLDKNNNAGIEIGNELFGNQTSLNNGQLAKNGFKALAEYDLNNDGVIDAKDEIYQQLQVWQDINQNAHVDQGELTGLQTIGIQQIDLAYTSAKEVDVNGNYHKQQGQFIWADGTAGKIDDVWFQADTLHSQINQAQIVEIDPSIAVLPDIQQFGNVDSLHQAMAKDTNGILQQLVEQFVQTDSLLVRQQLVTDIIYQWTGVADLRSHERGMYWDDRHLLALEKIMGRQYHSFADPKLTLSVGNNQAFALEEAWRLLRQKIYDQLYLQQKVPEFFEKIQITESNELDVTQLYSYIKQSSLIEVAELYDVLSRGPQLFKDVQNSLKEFVLNVSTPDLIDQILDQTLQVHISSVNDSFYVGSDGDDLLISNIGTDIFVGGEGVNIYFFSSNSGQDTIQASYLSENSSLTETHIILDTLPQDITVEVGPSDIILKISGTEDQLKIENATSESSTFKTITFADQTVWTVNDILAQPLLGTENDDYLIGIDARDNKIYGFAGNDYLYGAIGNDYLDGGTGDDELNGGYGINTYYFERGYANDIIAAPYLIPESASTETHIQLGVLPDDVSVELFDQSIRITIKDSGDILEIRDAFVENSVFKTITFTDQSIWTIADILAQPLLGTEGDDYLVGIDARDNKIYGFAGDDYLYGSIGNDYLDGGIGDDELNGGDGINTYVFNRAYGYDSIISYVDENSSPTETHILMDVLPSDISVEISYQDIFIRINNTDDLLEIRGVFTEFSAFKTITFADQTVWTIQDLQNSASMDSNQDESLTDLLNGLADNSNYEEYGYLFDELSDNQSLVGQLEGNNMQVLTDSLILEESSDVDYQFNLLTIQDMQKSDIDVDKLLIITNANSDSEDSQNVKNILTQKYQFDEVDDQIIFDNTSFSMVNNIGLWNTSFNQQFIA